MATVVVDTNVLAYHLIGTDEHRELLSRLFKSNLEFVVPSSMQAEILNVIWLAIRNNTIDLNAGLVKLEAVNRLIDRIVSISNLWGTALILSTGIDHSPYDTLFIALAKIENTQLLTFDRKLQRHFPESAISPVHYSWQ